MIKEGKVRRKKPYKSVRNGQKLNAILWESILPSPWWKGPLNEKRRNNETSWMFITWMNHPLNLIALISSERWKYHSWFGNPKPKLVNSSLIKPFSKGEEFHEIRKCADRQQKHAWNISWKNSFKPFKLKNTYGSLWGSWYWQCCCLTSQPLLTPENIWKSLIPFRLLGKLILCKKKMRKKLQNFYCARRYSL